MDKLKILQVTPDLRLGGLQRVVIDLACGLNALGHETHVCSLRGEGPLLAELQSQGITVHSMPWPSSGADRRMFLKVMRLLREEAFDVVHTHNTQAFLDAGLAAFLTGLGGRGATRIHTDHARPFPDSRKYMVAERLMSYAYDKVVGVSAHTTYQLRTWEKIPEHKLLTIPNGIDGAYYRNKALSVDKQALRHRYGLAGFDIVAGLGVRLEEQKGLRVLIEALPSVLAENPGFGLVVAGSGSQRGMLENLARRLSVSDQVRFLGPFSELGEFYPLLDIFVLPSLWEGLPLCLLEAMSLGLPIIATRVGGIPSLLDDGRDALLVPPSEPKALSDALLRLMRQPAFAAELGQRVRQSFDRSYDRPVMVRRYLEVYQSGRQRKKSVHTQDKPQGRAAA